MLMDENEDLISIIVPVYNMEQYLERCMNSIWQQTYKNLEIILVDDGSTDNSPKMCDDYAKKDSRIKVVHKENGGLSDARNIIKTYFENIDIKATIANIKRSRLNNENADELLPILMIQGTSPTSD